MRMGLNMTTNPATPDRATLERLVADAIEQADAEEWRMSSYVDSEYKRQANAVLDALAPYLAKGGV
jgi:hypothetical protein